MCRRVMVAVLLAAVITGFMPADTTPAVGLNHVSVVLDWYPNSDHAGLYAAIQRGIFRRDGLDVTARVPSDTSAQIKLVATGNATFGITYETDLLEARSRHIPVQSVMCIMQHPLDTVMTLRASGITRPRQLAGHTVGMAGSPSDVPIVSAMMRRDGSSIGKVSLVNVGYGLLPALLSRRVSAVVGVYWTWEAIQAEQRGYPVNVMRVEHWGVPNYCELVLIASEETVRTRPSEVRSMVQGMQQGYRQAEARPDLAWQALRAVDPTFNRVRNHQLLLRSVRLLRSAVRDAPTIGYQNPGQWSAYAAWVVRAHIVDHPVASGAAFTNQFLARGIR